MKGRRGRTAGLVVLPLLWLSLALAMPPTTAAGDGVVRAVLFSSPTCPHCKKVREEVLPSLGDRFRGRLQVAVLSTTTPAGRDLYWAAFRRYGVQQRGVPLLVVGDFALVGSDEIPRRLPTLVASYLAEGGVDWPALPGLGAVLAASTAAPEPLPTPIPAPEPAAAGPPATASPQPEPPPLPEPTPVPVRPAAPEAPAVPGVAAPAAATRPEAGASPRPAPVAVAALQRPKPAPSPTPATLGSPHGAAPVTGAAELPRSPAPPTAAPLLSAADGEEPSGFIARVLADPQGNGLAILVLVGMVAAVLRSMVVLQRPAPATRTNRLDWLTPLLALAGLGVAAYLAHVEVREIEAVCGPVGDCSTIQQSEYERLFGVVPIGVLGVLGFVSILVAWGVRRWGAGQASSWAAVALLAMTGLGTLFSIYLTFLEPFVIGATCLWCLSSAVIMTTLYGLALAPARAAAAGLRRRSSLGFSRQAT